MRSIRAPGICLTLMRSVLLVVALAQSATAAKVVAIGEVNGDYDLLVEVLKAKQLVGDDLSWSGGATQVVSLGNLIGDGSGRALEFLMRLGDQASAAAGAVFVVMGKHELHAFASGGHAHAGYLISSRPWSRSTMPCTPTAAFQPPWLTQQAPESFARTPEQQSL